MPPSARVLIVPFVVALGAAGLGGCSSPGGGTPPTTAAASDSAPAAPSGSAAGSASGASSGPSLEVTLNHLRIGSPLGVGVTADVTGQVPQVLNGDGHPIAAADTEAMGTRIVWGDGAEDGSDPGDVTCSTSGTLVALSEQYQYSHTYAKPGTYTVTYEVGACAPLQKVTKTLSVTVG